MADEQGRERERYKLPYGAILSVGEGETVEPGKVIAQWDPLTRPIVAEVSGKVEFQEMEEGLSINRQTDELTGLTNIMILDPNDRPTAAKDLRPAIRLLGSKTAGTKKSQDERDSTVYILPAGSILNYENGSSIGIGDIIARIPQEGSKTRDITGGLPRVADLFEARKPKEPAVLAEASGTVSFGKETKGKRRLVITAADRDWPRTCERRDPYTEMERNRSLRGREGRKGEVVCEGPLSAHDILRLKGVEELAKYVVDEIQEVYRLQGVTINDKHIEVIVRQMLRKRKY